MPRPCKRRRCQAYRGERVFKPRSVPMSQLEFVEISLSELEALRIQEGESHEDLYPQR